MTEKRFKYVEFTKNILSFDDNGVCKFFKEQEFEDWLNELHEEIMNLRAENTNFKLVVGEIIRDMQKYVDDNQLVYINQSYVDWIKENVDTPLYSQKGDEE